MTVAVLGFRPHTYWTAAVAVAGTPGRPQVLERRRIEFATGKERFIFHQAAEADPGAAPGMVEAARAATTANAVRDIGALVADLQGSGVEVRLALVPGVEGAAPLSIDEALSSHARMHAAEGRFYRDVVADACEAVGLTVRRAEERKLPGLLAARLRLDEAALGERLKAMGAVLGPPWSQDQRLAAMGAWLNLA